MAQFMLVMHNEPQNSFRGLPGKDQPSADLTGLDLYPRSLGAI